MLTYTIIPVELVTVGKHWIQCQLLDDCGSPVCIEGPGVAGWCHLLWTMVCAMLDLNSVMFNLIHAMLDLSLVMFELIHVVHDLICVLFNLSGIMFDLTHIMFDLIRVMLEGVVQGSGKDRRAHCLIIPRNTHWLDCCLECSLVIRGHWLVNISLRHKLSIIKWCGGHWSVASLSCPVRVVVSEWLFSALHVIQFEVTAVYCS